MATDIIIHDEKDNVGVVVIDKITPKQDCACWIMENDKTVQIQSEDEIQLGHKIAVSYTHLRAHETSLHLVCRLLLEKRRMIKQFKFNQ